MKLRLFVFGEDDKFLLTRQLHMVEELEPWCVEFKSFLKNSVDECYRNCTFVVIAEDEGSYQHTAIYRNL